MESLYLLVPVALIFLVIAIRVLFWAVNSGQYDDLKTEAYRILFDEDEKRATNPENEPSEAADSRPGEATQGLGDGLNTKAETTGKG